MIQEKLSYTLHRLKVLQSLLNQGGPDDKTDFNIHCFSNMSNTITCINGKAYVYRLRPVPYLNSIVLCSLQQIG
jgi:hypothetical protein